MKYRHVFERFVPLSAVDFCHKLWEEYNFDFKIKRARQTKLGDYRHDLRSGRHTITVNNDLNSYAFLLTYLHEVAHLITYNEYKGRVLPHGKEWKDNFVKIVKPVLNKEVFPEVILKALVNYFKNPKASSCSDPALYNVLRQFDKPSGKSSLSDIKLGEDFVFNNRRFTKIEKKRTRSVCLELSTNQKYLISELAEVIPL